MLCMGQYRIQFLFHLFSVFMSGKGLKYGIDVWTRISVSFRTGKKSRFSKTSGCVELAWVTEDVDTETTIYNYQKNVYLIRVGHSLLDSIWPRMLWRTKNLITLSVWTYFQNYKWQRLEYRNITIKPFALAIGKKFNQFNSMKLSHLFRRVWWLW